MQMRAPLQIQSIMKAMTDVVLPAIDPQNKLAQEQARLILGTLGLMARQMPLQYRFDCDELTRLISVSRQLRRLAAGGSETTDAVTLLGKIADEAESKLHGGKLPPAEAEQFVRDLRSAAGALVTAVFRDGESGCRRAVGSAVLEMSKEQVLRDRSWVLAQGWEPDPKAIPAIESLLA